MKLVKVKLLQDHTHAGKPHKAEEVIEVEDHRVGWLVERKIAVREKGAANTTAREN